MLPKKHLNEEECDKQISRASRTKGTSYTDGSLANTARQSRKFLHHNNQQLHEQWDRESVCKLFPRIQKILTLFETAAGIKLCKGILPSNDTKKNKPNWQCWKCKPNYMEYLHTTLHIPKPALLLRHHFHLWPDVNRLMSRMFNEKNCLSCWHNYTSLPFPFA